MLSMPQVDQVFLLGRNLLGDEHGGRLLEVDGGRHPEDGAEDKQCPINDFRRDRVRDPLLSNRDLDQDSGDGRQDYLGPDSPPNR